MNRNNANSHSLKLPTWLAWRYLLTKPKSSMTAFISRTSIAGLALAVALLIAVLSVMNGFEREMRERILGLLPQISLYQAYGEANWAQISQQVNEHPGVVASAPFIRLQGLLINGRKSDAVISVGIEPDAERKVSVINRYLEDPNILDQLGDGNVIIGRTLAKHLALQINDSAMLLIPNEQGEDQSTPDLLRLNVIGIIKSGTEVDRHAMLMHIDDARDIRASAEALRITSKNLFNVRNIAQDIVYSLPKGFVASDWTRTHGNLYSAIQLSKRLLLFLMFIVIGVALFNIISSLVLLVNNKRGDIAILRTMGMSPRDIMISFMIQGFFIAIVGTLIGIVMGIALSYSANFLVQLVESQFSYQLLNPDVYPLDYLPIDFRFWDIFWVSILSIVIGFLATVYPALRASKVAPAVALSNTKA